MKIRQIKISDIEKVLLLINNFVEKYSLLPVTKDFIFEHLNNYYVIDYKKKIIGVGFLRIYNKNLAEIRSLAIDTTYQDKGLGKKLVHFLIKKAKNIGIKKIFALSTTPKFFTAIDFKIVNKEIFPEKIWLDCQYCTKKNQCNETALLYEI